MAKGTVNVAQKPVNEASFAPAADLTAHIGNKSNPHSVTKEQVGLGNVPNVATNNQTPTYSEASSLTALTSGEKLSVAFGKIAKAVSDLISHLSNKSNPHGVTAAQVGADPKGTASSAVSSHNTNTSAHNDIRDLIAGLTTRLNALANSDDTTLDQMSEVVAYIKSNKSLIDSITTSKVNVSDIINNLTTNVSNKPLSAAQGVAIKALIDALQTELDSTQANLSSHTGNTSNPHNVTKAQVGLGNVPNVATNNQTPTYTQASSLANLTSGEKLSVSMGKIMKAIADLISHLSNKSNPHGVTAAQVDAAPTSHNHAGASLNPAAIEFSGASNNGGFIDFHYGSSTEDYTSRIIESDKGVLNFLVDWLAVNNNRVLVSADGGSIGNFGFNATDGFYVTIDGTKYRIPFGFGGPMAETRSAMGLGIIGEYTGNGSSTQRTINTGGHGHALMIWSVQYLLFVTPRGGICLKCEGNSITEVTFSMANFINGVLTIGTADAKLNASNTVYAYQVL